jgi:hypothetical protein
MTLSEYLISSLARFRGVHFKDSHFVDFRLDNLDMVAHLEHIPEHTRTKIFVTVYVIITAILCLGGHYMALVLNGPGSVWYHYDDGAPVTELMGQIPKDDAYLLFSIS